MGLEEAEQDGEEAGGLISMGPEWLAEAFEFHYVSRVESLTIFEEAVTFSECWLIASSMPGIVDRYGKVDREVL